MTINFTTPIAHQTGGNYAAFNNAVVVGRPFRQPLITAPNPNNFASGLELFLSNTGDVANVYSWLDCILTWQASTVATPGHRLVLETEPLVLSAPGRTRTLASLKTLEARPKKAIYENVDQATVQAALNTLLTNAYNTAAASAGSPNSWHPSMRMRVKDGSTTRKLKEYIDNHKPAAATIANLVNDFLTGAAKPVINKIRVKAGDQIGRAAAYLASDSLPASPSFNLGKPTDANRARRLTFHVIDLGKQVLNPIYYLNVYMRQMLVPATNRIVNSLTNIVNGGTLRHPLVTLFPDISAAKPPVAREQVGGQYRFPIGALNAWHGYPDNSPVSTLEWRYNNLGTFEARARVAGTAVPKLARTASATTKVTNLWNPPGVAAGYGGAIGIICSALQIPCELIGALVGSEALHNLDPRATRLEPLRDKDRKSMHKAGIAAAVELAYDHTIGIQANVTKVVYNNNNTSRLDITLSAKRSWRKNNLRYYPKSQRRRVLLGNIDRLRVTANTGGKKQTNYQITVRDQQMRGGFASNGNQISGTTLFYSPTTRAAGQARDAGAQHTLPRAGMLRRFHVTASNNTLKAYTSVTVLRNGTATPITVTLAAGAQAGSDNAHTVAASIGDNISIQVTTAGTTGNIRNLRVELYYAPGTGGSVLVLEGHSTSVPNPVPAGKAVKPGRTLTWNQLQTIVIATNGSHISPGLLQTLISTARIVVPFLNAVAPNIYTTLRIPAPPANAGGFLNDWLLTGTNSLLLGAAYIRKGYNLHRTAFDLPIVGAAYNAGSPQTRNNSRWGLVYFSNYVEHAAPHLNAAVNLFNGAPVPAPTVRLMR